MEDKLDKAIELTKKKVELLKELKESLKYEKCKYHLVEHDDVLPIRYSLFKIDSQNNLSHGSLSRVKSYIRTRNIDEQLIYKKP